SESNPGRSLGTITMKKRAVWKTVPPHKTIHPRQSVKFVVKKEEKEGNSKSTERRFPCLVIEIMQICKISE
ncbi:MAG: hypothetical protein PUF36_05935, partial [Prevotella sp.]|nr:hypothetical protein [Prevotella sp.]